MRAMIVVMALGTLVGCDGSPGTPAGPEADAGPEAALDPASAAEPEPDPGPETAADAPGEAGPDSVADAGSVDGPADAAGPEGADTPSTEPAPEAGPDPLPEPGHEPSPEAAPEPPAEAVADVPAEAVEAPADTPTGDGSGEEAGAGEDAPVEAQADIAPDPNPYPEFEGARLFGIPVPKEVPGIRLFASYTGSDTDPGTCGAVTWRLGNRIRLSGKSPDGASRGRLVGAQVYRDVDDLDEADLYRDANGATAVLPFTVELLDAAGAVLWRGRLRDPVQTREYVMSSAQEQVGQEPTPFLVSIVSSMLQADLEAITFVIPDLPGAVALRFDRPLSVAEKAAIASGGEECPYAGPERVSILGDLGGSPLPQVPLAAIPEVPLSEFMALVGTPEVVRLHGDAPPDRAVSFAILSEGYTADRKSAFEADAAEVAASLLGLEPFASFADHVNVWRVWTPSAEAGASYDCACAFWDKADQNCTDPFDGCRDEIRTTAYGAVFSVRALYGILQMLNPTPPPSPSIDRNLFARHVFRTGLAMSLSAPDGTPVSADAAFVIVDSPKAGGFGLHAATFSTAYRTWGTGYLGEIATHEMGHVFGMLGDEYRHPGDVCQVFELTPLFPNFASIPGAAPLPWDAWATLSPPFPHTEDQGTSDDVGCFVPGPGGGECLGEGGSERVCRPQKKCKMKTNDGEFCAVCRDHVVRRIFAELDPLKPTHFAVDDLGGGKFRLDAEPALAGVEAAWQVDGEGVQDGPYAPLILDTSVLGPGEHEVRLIASYPTPLVRIWESALREELSVTVTIPPP